MPCDSSVVATDEHSAAAKNSLCGRGWRPIPEWRKRRARCLMCDRRRGADAALCLPGMDFCSGKILHLTLMEEVGPRCQVVILTLGKKKAELLFHEYYKG